MVGAGALAADHAPVARAPRGLARKIERRGLGRMVRLMTANAIAIEAARLERSRCHGDCVADIPYRLTPRSLAMKYRISAMARWRIGTRAWDHGRTPAFPRRNT